MHRVLMLALCAVLAVGLYLPNVSSPAAARSFHVVGIWTRDGVPDLHRGHYCYGCHQAGPPINKVTSQPKEPCGECHRPATEAEMRLGEWQCRQRGMGCPIFINYRQPDGSQLSFFFGNR